MGSTSAGLTVIGVVVTIVTGLVSGAGGVVAAIVTNNAASETSQREAVRLAAAGAYDDVISSSISYIRIVETSSEDSPSALDARSAYDTAFFKAVGFAGGDETASIMHALNRLDHAVDNTPTSDEARGPLVDLAVASCKVLNPQSVSGACGVN